MENRNLNIKGTNLESGQLQKYITQIAEEHIISKKSDKETYPIKRFKRKLWNNITSLWNTEWTLKIRNKNTLSWWMAIRQLLYNRRNSKKHRKKFKQKTIYKITWNSKRKIQRICQSICISKWNSCI